MAEHRVAYEQIIKQGYTRASTYDSSTIGCVRNQTPITDEYLLDTYSEAFIGAMSALHFIALSSSRISEINLFLNKIYLQIPMQDLLTFALSPTAYEINQECKLVLQKESSAAEPPLISKHVDKIFLMINPKYETKTHVKDELLFVSPKKDFLNQISEIRSGTSVFHNYQASETLANISGTKALLYTMSLLMKNEFDAQAVVNPSLESIFIILTKLLATNKQRMTIMLQQENSILLMRHLLEKLSKKLDGKTFAAIYGFLDSLFRFSYDASIIEKYLEHVIFNADIWRLCPTETQDEFIKKADMVIKTCSGLPFLIKIFDFILTCIEIYCSSQDAELHNKERILQLSKIVSKIPVDEAMISKFVGYINIYYIRRQRNCFLQAFYMMRIMLRLFIANQAEFCKEAYASLKKKQECRTLSSLFLLLDYVLYVKETGSSAEYTGIQAKSSSAKKEREGSEDVGSYIDDAASAGGGPAVTAEWIRSPEGIYTLDCIIGMCLFILINFDWSQLLNAGINYQKVIAAKMDEELIKNESKIKASEYQSPLDLVATILFENAKSLQKNAVLFVISYWFSREQKKKEAQSPEQRIGKATYSALLCTALEGREMNVEPYSMEQHACNITFFASTKKAKLIKNPTLLNFIFWQLNIENALSDEAKKGFLADLMFAFTNDKALLNEILGMPEIILNIFSLNDKSSYSDIVLLQSAFIYEALLLKKAVVLAFLTGDPIYNLEVIDKVIERLIKGFKENSGSATSAEEKKGPTSKEKYIETLNSLAVQILDVYYFVEDLVSGDVNILNSPIFSTVATKLVLLAHMLDHFLYFSLPSISIMDERLIPFNEDKELAFQARLEKQRKVCFSLPREGGIMRILLKFIFLLIKLDTTASALPLALLRFYLFRTKEAKHAMIAAAGLTVGIKKQKKGGEKKDESLHVLKEKRYCSMMDLILKTNVRKIESYNAFVEAFLKCHYSDEQSLLEKVKISKNQKSVFSKIPTLFENPTSLLIYILGSIFQLLQYNLLDFQSYYQLQENHAQESLNGLNPKIYNDKYKQITELLYELLTWDRAIPAAKTALEKALLGEPSAAFMDSIQNKYISGFPKVHGISLYSVNSILDCVIIKKSLEGQKVVFKEILSDKGKPQVRDPKGVFTSFKKEWIKLATDLLNFATPENLPTLPEILHKRMAAPEFHEIIQPHLLWISTHSLYSLDCAMYKYFGTKLFKDAQKLLVSECYTKPDALLLSSLCPEIVRLRENIVNYFPMMSLSKDKIERDDLRAGFQVYGKSLFQSFKRQQKAETGIFFSKKAQKKRQAAYSYFANIYNKMLAKCPLANKLKSDNRFLSVPWGEFVTLKSSRDNLLRASKLKPMKKLQNNLSFQHTLKYTRRHVMKKFLILHLLKDRETVRKALSSGYFATDFQEPLCKILKPIYHVQPITLKSTTNSSEGKDKIAESPNAGGLRLYQKKSIDSTTEGSRTLSESISEALPSQAEELCGGNGELRPISDYIPKSCPQFKAELVTIQGTIYGKLFLNSMTLSFKSEPRDLRPEKQSKYKFGPNEFVRLNVTNYNKKWALSSVTEIIIKRYNLVRQAVEIYLSSNKSLFFCFYKARRASKFLKNVKFLKSKKPELAHLRIVDRPEKIFGALPYTSMWINGEISNFEYLQYLNKYGGRSFNDLNQYPVFPWILQDYDSASLNYAADNPASQKIYRNLKLPIAAITEEKRKTGEEKLNVLVQEADVISPYQFGTHYLPGRVVLGYLLRVEPYASLLIRFEKGPDATSRMFHILRTSWRTCCIDSSDNKELIPEFFYLPELFANYNHYAYGKKQPEDDAGKMLNNNKSTVMVDQVILPGWAKTNHEFVKANALALESMHSSVNLHHWIDLVFGEKQQDQHSYNRFKTLCDESTVSKIIGKLNENNITEIQEFGSNPVKLFRLQHPGRKLEVLRKKIQYSLFENPQSETDKSFVIFKIADTAAFFGGDTSTPSPILRLFATELKGPVLAISQHKLRIFRSRVGSEINGPSENSISFVAKEQSENMKLQPMKKIYSDSQKLLNWDAARCILSLAHSEYLITCRHFDNSIRIISTTTGQLKQTLIFHTEMVNCIAITKNENWLYSGSADGVVAKWNLEKLTLSPLPTSWCCDHSSYVTSIDTSHELDIVASSGFDGTISLRVISTGKIFRVIHVNSTKEKGYIYMVRLSHRGYIIVTCRYRSDTILVYSINGELICSKNAGELINGMILNEQGYTFVTCGDENSLLQYDLLTLRALSLQDKLDSKFPKQIPHFKEFSLPDIAITAMALTKQENFQQLIIGMSNGTVFTFKISPRLIGSQILDVLGGFLAGRKK